MLKRDIKKKQEMRDSERISIDHLDLESFFSSDYESNMPSFDIYKAGVGSGVNIIKYWMIFTSELADKHFSYWDDDSLSKQRAIHKAYIDRIKNNIKDMTIQTNYKPISVFMTSKLNDLTTSEAMDIGNRQLKKIFDNNIISIKEYVPIGELVYDARSHANRNAGKYIGLLLAGPIIGLGIGALIDSRREKDLKTVKISTDAWVKLYTEFNNEVYNLLISLRKTVNSSIKPIK